MFLVHGKMLMVKLKSTIFAGNFRGVWYKSTTGVWYQSNTYNTNKFNINKLILSISLI